MKQHMDEKYCEIAASVPTGFESVAKEEIEELFVDVPQIETTRGRACFKLKLKDVTKECCLQQMQEFVPELQWTLGLEVWSAVRSNLNNIQEPKRKKSVHRSNGQGDKRTPASIGDSSSPEGLTTNNNSCSETAVIESNSSQVDTKQKSPDAAVVNSCFVAAEAGCSSEDVNAASSDQLQSCGQVDRSTVSNVDGSRPGPIRVPVPGLATPLFRATCYRTGNDHCFQSPQAAAAFGGAVNDFTGWKVDLEHYDVEVILEIDSNDVCVCIALTTESLHRRNIVKFGNTTLRPTIAYGMLRYCQIKPGDVVCDPMCGGGSIPIEGALGWPLSQHLCGDNFEHAPGRTLQNVKAVNRRRLSRGEKPIVVDVFRWDVRSLPLMDESVDVIITDMPFGKRSGSWQNNWLLYPRAMQEMARVCRCSTGRACLLTFDKKCISRVFSSVSHLWHRGPTVGINLGGLSACLYLLYRTSTVYSSAEKTTFTSAASNTTC